MKNDLEILSEIIATIHIGIDDKSQMVSTQVIDSAFRHAASQAKLHLNEQDNGGLDYINIHIDLTLKLDAVVEMTLKHLNKMIPLNPFDFYRLMRCRKIESGLSDLISFYQEQKMRCRQISE